MIMRPELISSVSQVLSQRIQNDKERKEEIRFFRLVKQDGRQIYIHIRQSFMDMYVDLAYIYTYIYIYAMDMYVDLAYTYIYIYIRRLMKST